MNTTARVETTGEGGKIHISEATAQLLRKDGFENWLVRRKDLVYAKGLGRIQTYFLKSSSPSSEVTRTESAASTSEGSDSSATGKVEEHSPAISDEGDEPYHMPFRFSEPAKAAPGIPIGGPLVHILEKGQKMFRLDEEVAKADWNDEMSV